MRLYFGVVREFISIHLAWEPEVNDISVFPIDGFFSTDGLLLDVEMLGVGVVRKSSISKQSTSLISMIILRSAKIINRYNSNLS